MTSRFALNLMGTGSSSGSASETQRNFMGFVTPQMFGAYGDSTHDDTESFREAIDFCLETHRALYIPAVPLYYKITGALEIYQGDFSILGEGASSTIYRSNGGTIFEVGDNTTQISNVKLDSVNLQSANSGTGFIVQVRKAPNTIIQNCCISGNSASYGLIDISESWCSRILNNTMNTRDIGIKAYNSTNALWCAGNRIDGSSEALTDGVGIYFTGTQAVFSGNTVEAFDTCMQIAGRGITIQSYFESYYSVCIEDVGQTDGLNISGCIFSGDLGAETAIKLAHSNGVNIQCNYSFYPSTSDYFCLLADALPDSDYNVAQNVYADANQAGVIP